MLLVNTPKFNQTSSKLEFGEPGHVFWMNM